MITSMEHTAHRPYPPPSRPWIMKQGWRDFIFAHWPVAEASLRPLVPPGLEIDTYDHRAWVGIYAFRTQALSLRALPNVSLFSPFYGINLRTYVRHNGIPGVYFLRLHSTHRIALRLARAWYRLNYFPADIRYSAEGDLRQYDGALHDPGNRPLVYRIRYRPRPEVYHPRPGTLDHFLTERYRLYSADAGGRLYCAEIHHPPWPLQEAEAEIAGNSLIGRYPLDLSGSGPIVHASPGVEVYVWNIGKA